MLVFCALYLVLCIVNAQPTIQWTKSLGGSGEDDGTCICLSSDGGFIVCGLSFSNNGNVFGNHGSWDGWLVKLNSSGAIQWTKCYGGSSIDRINSIIQTNDGGYICAGYTYSNDLDVSGNHGHGDAWILKLNDTGAIQWTKCYGGTSGASEAFTIIQTNDGGYIFSGGTAANDGDLIGGGYHGGGDGWVVKLNNIGTIQWQKCYGGSTNDCFYKMIPTNDGCFAMSGIIYSNDGDGCSANHGGGDIWATKIDSSGHLLWSNCLGGNGYEVSYSIIQTLDGGFAVGGYTESSNNGDVMCGTHTWYILLVAKLTDSGSFQWSKCYADTIANGGFLSPSNDSGFVIAGNSSYWGAWIVKVDISGNIHWTGRYGSYNGNEDVSGIIHCNDGGYAIITSSNGTNHDVTGHHGALGTSDYWVVKLAPDTATGIDEIKTLGGITVYPNPASSSITVKSEELRVMSKELKVTDVYGRVVYKEMLTASETKIDVSKWSAGVYFYEVREANGTSRGKFIVQQ